MTRPLTTYNEDGDEVVRWAWRKKFFSTNDAKAKSGDVYYTIKEDYVGGTRGKWIAWRAPLEADEAGQVLFSAGSQPLTPQETEQVQRAYEQRNWQLYRSNNVK